jgi:hypothetical protein
MVIGWPMRQHVPGAVSGAGCGRRRRETWDRNGGWDCDTVCDSDCDSNCQNFTFVCCIGGEGLHVNLRAIYQHCLWSICA